MTFTEFIDVANLHGWYIFHNNTRMPAVISQAERGVKGDQWIVEYHSIGRFEGEAVMYNKYTPSIQLRTPYAAFFSARLKLISNKEGGAL